MLIVAPLSILGVWEEEFQKFAAFPYALAVLSGTSAKKLDTLRHMNGTALQVVVVNYESAWRLEKALTAWHPDLIIADEGHKIKTHNIAASKAMHRMGTKASYRLLLTGTVITNKAIDVFSQYKFLNPAIYGNSFYAFRNRYFDMVGYGNHTPVLKKSMEGELTEKLHSISYRATKAECLDLPETTDVIRQIELESAALRIYRGLVKESYAELAGGEVTATNILTRLLRLSQLTGGFLGNDETAAVEQVSAAKLSALEDILDGAMAEEKAGYHRPLYSGDQGHLQAAGKAGPWVFLHHRRGEKPGRAGGAVPEGIGGHGLCGTNCHSGAWHYPDRRFHHGLLFPRLFHVEF